VTTIEAAVARWRIRNLVLWPALLLLSCQLPAHAADATRTQVSAGYGYLSSLPRMWSQSSTRDCKTYEVKNILRLHPSFATAAANFLSAFSDAYGVVAITSAHRDSDEQQCVCEGEKGPCAGRLRTKKVKRGKKTITVHFRGLSRHSSGLALDVWPGIGTDAEFLCMHEFAERNPRFGVQFPLGMRDRPHMEMRRGWSPRLRYAALAGPTVQPCSSLPAYGYWMDEPE
jgi:hypothetical protein